MGLDIFSYAILKNMIESSDSDGGSSSGGWPADLPKPSVGGYGYTEQGEQVLFDGDLLIDQQLPTGAVIGNINIDSLEVGETYKIVWNGVDYTCECMTFNLGGGDEIVYLGNLSIAGLHNPTDYPFLFVYQPDGYMVGTLSAGTYSIKLSKDGGTIHKIDEKYLPDDGGMVVTIMPKDGGGYIADKTFEEIKDAVNSGMDIKCVFKAGNTTVLTNLSSYYF